MEKTSKDFGVPKITFMRLENKNYGSPKEASIKMGKPTVGLLGYKLK